MLMRSTQKPVLIGVRHGNSTAKHKKGFTLIEAAIVMAIVGLVVGGIWGGRIRGTGQFPQVKTRHRICWLSFRICGSSIMGRRIALRPPCR